MPKRPTRLTLLCAAACITLASLATASDFDGLTLVVVDAPDIAALHRAREAVHAGGGRIGVMVPPSLMLGWVDPASASRLVGRAGIRDIRWTEADASRYALVDDQSLSALRTFNAIVGGVYRARREADALAPGGSARRDGPDALLRDQPQIDDVLDNLRRAGLDDATLEARGILARTREGASSLTWGDKMTGTVAVTFFLVESDGTGSDPDSWTWTPEDMQEYMDDAVVGLLWWAGRASGHLDCWVTFLVNHVSALDPRCQQWVEPSLHNSGFVTTWASNVMAKMGYTAGSHFSRVDAFNAWQEATYQANSAYSAFIAYNPIGAPSNFPDGGYAFAWIYGPYFWSLFRTPGWTHDVVVSHETGHIFGACDEYAGGCSSCTDTCSLYGGPNANCEECNPMSRPCMMRSNENSLCQYTKTMIGWDAATPCAPAPPAPLPAPTLVSVSPGDGLEGSEINLTLTGGNFVAGVQADLGPQVFVHTTTRVNSSTLQVWASVFNGAALGPVDVVVRNRDGQTATLAGAFEILPTRRHYFSPSGGNAFPYITPADAGTVLADVMAAAVSGDTVLVPTMTLPSFAIVVDRGVTLQGAWNASFTARNVASGKTVLDLNGMVDFLPTSDGAGIDGFILENGDGRPDFVPVNARYAGALRVYQSAVSIRNCEIRNSSTGPPEQLGYGGGVYGYQSTVVIENCHIHDNAGTVGGALYLDQCSGSVSGSIIEDNSVVAASSYPAEGSGVYVVASSNVTLSDNAIRRNDGGQSGGGVLVESSTNVVMQGGVVEYNHASFGGGGVAFDASSGALLGVVARRNSAFLAGGALVSGAVSFQVAGCRIEWNSATITGGLSAGGDVSVTHNLLVGNSAAQFSGGMNLSGIANGVVAGNSLDRNAVGAGAGGISLSGVTAPVFNNIVTNSTGTGIACSGAPPALFDFNNVWNASAGLYSGCAPGPSSISADPVFVDTMLVDYHLAVHSPCIDRGRTGAPYDDPDGSRGDMGWYGSHSFAMDQPALVQNLTVGVAGADRVLQWDASPEPDVEKYAVYANGTSGFVPGASNFVAFVNAPATSYNAGPVTADTYYRVNAIDADGYAGGYSAEASASPATSAAPIAYRNRLFQNTPNPFNPVTEIRFELAAPSHVTITIFDAAGRVIRALENAARPAGSHAVRWNGRNDAGAPASSGVYFYRMRAAGFDETRKMVLLK